MGTVLLLAAGAKIKIETQDFVFGTACERLLETERDLSLKSTG